MIDDLVEKANMLFQELENMSTEKKIEAINLLRKLLHAHSPFADEPIDCVQWVPCNRIQANDYNPNTVAPPEIRLLKLSIRSDGFTQPIVAYRTQENYLIVDGFHRQEVGKNTSDIRSKLHGHLPVVTIRNHRSSDSDRMSATIRHNRARGIHGIVSLTDVVVALLREGWRDEDVARELGMDPDEVLRFKQVSGLPELFRDRDYSKSWK